MIPKVLTNCFIPPFDLVANEGFFDSLSINQINTFLSNKVRRVRGNSAIYKNIEPNKHYISFGKERRDVELVPGSYLLTKPRPVPFLVFLPNSEGVSRRRLENPSIKAERTKSLERCFDEIIRVTIKETDEYIRRLITAREIGGVSRETLRYLVSKVHKEKNFYIRIPWSTEKEKQDRLDFMRECDKRLQVLNLALKGRW